jgi:glycosyltransferase involved in cell wall biosynthesis
VNGVDGPCVGAAPERLDWALAEVKAWNPDVCYSNNMALLDVECALLDQAPVVKFMHAYFGTCISALKTHGFPTGRACGRTLGAACLALYVPRHCGALRPTALVDGYRWARSQQALLRRYQRIVIASDHMAEEYMRHGAPRERLVTLPLFPSLPLGPYAGSANHTVLFMGRMTALKGGDVLVRAMPEVVSKLGRPVRLVMAGEGPQRVEWQQLATRLRVSAEFPGWLDAEKRMKVLAQSSVLAVPSVWPEPFGLVGLEAAARGVPAVAFDTGGIRQWLRHDISGTLVPPAAGSHGIAAALTAVLGDRERRERLSRGAHAVAKEMSLDAHTAALERVLLMATGKRSSAPHMIPTQP